MPVTGLPASVWAQWLPRASESIAHAAAASLAGIRAGSATSPPSQVPVSGHPVAGWTRLTRVRRLLDRCGGSAGGFGPVPFPAAFTPASRWTAACEPHRRHQRAGF